MVRCGARIESSQNMNVSAFVARRPLFSSVHNTFPISRGFAVPAMKVVSSMLLIFERKCEWPLEYISFFLHNTVSHKARILELLP